jgi:hypothetical protein
MPSPSWRRRLPTLAVLTAAVTLFACLADNALRSHRPFGYPVPTLPDSQPGRGHGAIVGVVLDSASREPLPGWGAAVYWNDDPMPPPKLTWIYDEAVGGFGVYGLIPDTRGYRIKCRAPNSRTLWSRRLRITSGAVDTVVCLMRPSDPRKPEGPYENWTPCAPDTDRAR